MKILTLAELQHDELVKWQDRALKAEAANRDLIAANAQKDAEIARLKKQLTNVQHLAVNIQEQRDEDHASVGEKWIDVKQEEMPMREAVLAYTHPYNPNDNGMEIFVRRGGVPTRITHYRPLPAPPTLHTDKES